MGTNYYIHKHIPEVIIKELKDLVNEDNIYDGTLQKALEDYQEIHIGKSSAGWQFLFNHNDCKYYEKTQKSIDKFLRKTIAEGGKFVDEYGTEISVDAFWEMVKAKEHDMDLASYRRYEEEKWEDYQKNPENYADAFFKPSKPLPYDLNHPETFSRDEWNLRFSDSTEFC